MSIFLRVPSLQLPNASSSVKAPVRSTHLPTRKSTVCIHTWVFMKYRIFLASISDLQSYRYTPDPTYAQETIAYPSLLIR